MIFAWYAHLKNLNDKPWWIAALANWGIAFFEYFLQVPGNRIGYTSLSLAQLKIMQDRYSTLTPPSGEATMQPTKQASLQVSAYPTGEKELASSCQ